MQSTRYTLELPDTGLMGTSAKVIYFVQVAEDGPIKIGYCNKRAGIRARMSELQVGCPWPLVVRRIMQVEGLFEERRLHERFADHRIGGEWFLSVPEVAEEAHGVAMSADGNMSVAKAALDYAQRYGYDEGYSDGEHDAFVRLRRDLERYAGKLTDSTVELRRAA